MRLGRCWDHSAACLSGLLLTNLLRHSLGISGAALFYIIQRQGAGFPCPMPSIYFPASLHSCHRRSWYQLLKILAGLLCSRCEYACFLTRSNSCQVPCVSVRRSPHVLHMATCQAQSIEDWHAGLTVIASYSFPAVCLQPSDFVCSCALQDCIHASDWVMSSRLCCWPSTMLAGLRTVLLLIEEEEVTDQHWSVSLTACGYTVPNTPCMQM